MVFLLSPAKLKSHAVFQQFFFVISFFFLINNEVIFNSIFVLFVFHSYKETTKKISRFILKKLPFQLELLYTIMFM